MRYSLSELLIIVPLILVSLTVHEFAHSFMALKLGDDTSKNMGRLSLNPIRHVDPFGLLFIVIVGFGWAKPVLIDKDKLSNPIRDDILIALSGPISNFILACIFGVLLRVVSEYNHIFNESILNQIIIISVMGIWLNLALGVFNLIPIPPLDGSHLITSFLDRNSSFTDMFLKYGTGILFGILMLERILDKNILPIIPIINYLYENLIKIVF
jgi:Zn-dependent protease